MFIRNTLLPSHREGREKKRGQDYGLKVFKDVKHLKNADSLHIWDLEDRAL